VEGDIGIVQTENRGIRPKVDAKDAERVENLEVAMLVSFYLKGAVGMKGRCFSWIPEDTTLGDELVLNMLAREIGSGHSIEYAGMRERRWGIGRGELILHLLETPFIYAGGKGIGA
jgi:hypothetical protein